MYDSGAARDSLGSSKDRSTVGESFRMASNGASSRVIGPYRIDYCGNRTTEQLHTLISEIARQNFSHWSSRPEERSRAGSVLGGRSPVWRAELTDVGPVILKPYYRGGIMRYLIQRTYLGFGESRATREFKLLLRVRELGVSAPGPVAALTHGGMLYRAWLVTREIVGARSLAEIMTTDEEAGRDAMEQLVPQIATLVQHRVMHVDLHPGNVLIDPQGKVYILDFDKASEYRGALPKLRDHYVLRWRRAVLKHGLPDLLSEMMSLGLRRTATVYVAE